MYNSIDKLTRFIILQFNVCCIIKVEKTDLTKSKIKIKQTNIFVCQKFYFVFGVR